ncbi:MAG: tetratricopeptide repeat protein [Kofleriaceae bacterium]|nr:tetratricopeptide repeat protein [Myxococcales bacterium]MCB9559470.1 tetratricopeptide repeat protein [Kofleriaceae bacterium]MCB9574231.1 tetratricopeptide repeat protein [Kofleriaceae bacterium]
MRQRFPSLTLLVAAAAATGATGCFWVTTKSEGKALRHDIDGLDNRVAAKETEIGGKVTELQSTLDEAAKVLKRNSADLGADVERIDDEQRKALGLITAAQTNAEEVRVAFERYRATTDERLAALESHLAALESKGSAANMAAQADALWKEGKTAFGASKWEEAREAFKKLTLDFPQHDRADDAQYFRAETYFSEKNYEGAIPEYQKVWDKWADSELADDALFRAGEAAEALKQCTEARAYYGLLGQKYPKSSLAKRASDKDKSLKSSLKDKKKCKS